jgi:hypothetical protein
LVATSASQCTGNWWQELQAANDPCSIPSVPVASCCTAADPQASAPECPAQHMRKHVCFPPLLLWAMAAAHIAAVGHGSGAHRCCRPWQRRTSMSKLSWATHKPPNPKPHSTADIHIRTAYQLVPPTWSMTLL